MAEFAGDVVFVYVDTNDVGKAGSPNWVKIGQQIDGEFNGSTDTTDASTKDDNLWPKQVVVGKTWTVTVGGVLDGADSGYSHIWDLWIGTGTALGYFKIDYAPINGVAEEGQCVISGLTRTFPRKDMVKFTFELTGNSEWENS